MRIVKLSVLWLIVVGMTASTAGAADWPFWLGPDHDGKSADKGLLKSWPAGGPRLLWKAQGIGSGYSSATVADQTVYVTGDIDGKLIISAFDLEGKPLWTAEHGQAWGGDPSGCRSSCVIDGGKLYLISGQGLIGCHDAKTGKMLWTREMVKDFGGSVPGWGYAESVLIYKDMAVVTPGRKNCMVALDKTSGQPIWKSQGFSAEANYGSILPVTFEGVELFIVGTAAGIVAFDAKTGRMHWSNNFSAGNTANCPTPAYSDGYVVWANGYGKGGICLKLRKSGQQVLADVAYTTNDLDCHHGGYIIEDGYIYGNHADGWVCLELKTGRKMWFDRAGKIGKGSIAYADGMLYLYSENNGNLALASFSPKGLTVKGMVNVRGSGPSWSHPVIAGGRLYVRYDSNLYCFDVKAP